MDLSALFPAFFQALEPGMLGMVLLGTILGIVVGSLPGLTSTMGVALLVPFSDGISSSRCHLCLFKLRRLHQCNSVKYSRNSLELLHAT